MNAEDIVGLLKTIDESDLDSMSDIDRKKVRRSSALLTDRLKNPKCVSSGYKGWGVATANGKKSRSDVIELTKTVIYLKVKLYALELNVDGLKDTITDLNNELIDARIKLGEPITCESCGDCVTCNEKVIQHGFCGICKLDACGDDTESWDEHRETCGVSV